MRGLGEGLVARVLGVALSMVLGAGPALQGVSPAYAEETAVQAASLVSAVDSGIAAEPSPPDDQDETARPSRPVTPTVVREVIGKRTETSKHYLLSDGSYRAVISEAPVHYKDSTAEWVDIETELVPDPATGGYVTKAAPVRGRFADQSNGQPVRVEGKGYSVGIDMLGVAEGARLVYGNKIRYLAVANDTSLEYEALDDGVKETLLLGSADAPTTFSFRVSLDGLDIREVRPGEWAFFRPGADEPELSMGGLCVFDSSESPAGEPAYCAETTMTVVPGGSAATVMYQISPEWLSNPDRVFPIMVDPSVTKAASADTFLSSEYPSTNYGSSTELKCGYYDSTTGHNRSLVKFDLSSITDNTYVDSATFSVYQFHTYYTDTPKITKLGKVKKSWTEASTWNSLGCTVNDEGGLCTFVDDKSPSGRNIWVNWGVTSTVQD